MAVDAALKSFDALPRLRRWGSVPMVKILQHDREHVKRRKESGLCIDPINHNREPA
jgi:hypothetical protein